MNSWASSRGRPSERSGGHVRLERVIALERRKQRTVDLYARLRSRGLVVGTPNVTLAEWWRGRTDHRETLLRGILVEPVSDDVMKLAGVALGETRATTIDAIIAAFAVQRMGIVYTSDVGDFEALRSFFPSPRVFAI
jgi:predicted nucleic acid-binding protein